MCGSNTGDGMENRLGPWLMLTCFQTLLISSLMFLTAMSANPLSATLTLNTIKQTIGWTDWAKAAIVPGLVSLIVVPLLLYVIYPPTVKTSPDAPKLARENLEKMGPMSTNEIVMAGTLLITVNSAPLCKILTIVVLTLFIHCIHVEGLVLDDAAICFVCLYAILGGFFPGVTGQSFPCFANTIHDSIVI